METIEKEFKKYNQIKMDLLKMSKCIECCDESQKDMYQNLCIEYSKELKNMKASIESIYGVTICQCYEVKNEIKAITRPNGGGYKQCQKGEEQSEK